MTTTTTTTTTTTKQTLLLSYYYYYYYYYYYHLFRYSSLVELPRSRVVYNFGPVCLSVCQTITFETLDVGNLFSLIQYTPGDTGQLRI